MCNLYNIKTNQEAIRSLANWDWTSAGNLEPSLEVYPDYQAPIVRNVEGKRELAKVRWGLPSSSQAIYQAASKRADKMRAKGQPVDFDQLLRMEPDRGTTNVRRTDSKHWTRWLGVENRCVVPATSFAEPDPAGISGQRPNAWFAVNETQPLFFFAGLWVKDWTCVRKIKEGEVTCDLFAFLTTDPNGVVAPIHPKAMPVILTERDEIETWLTAPWEEAKVLQRPLPDDMLRIVPAPAQPDEEPAQAALL